jgi:hypothetical protein
MKNANALSLTTEIKKTKSSKLKIVKAKSTPRSTAARFSVPVNQLGVIDQALVAFERQNLLATLFGGWLGGIVPFGVFMTAHYSTMKTFNISGVEVSGAWLWILVAAGLIYSATTVFNWGVSAFSSKSKAFGFVVLLEGILTFSPEYGLAIAALVTMMLINAIATSCNLISQRKEARAEARKAAKAGK